MATEPKKAEAPATVYIVAKGVLVQRDPKTRKKTNIVVGKEYVPADAEELGSLLASGAIVTAGEYAKQVASPLAQDAIAAANARAEAAEAELAALKAAKPDA